MTAAVAQGLGGPARAGFGQALRGWRRHRRMSQLDLALEAEVSPRHLSFLETGRSMPSQTMVTRLLDALRVPHWDRNRLLLAAGFAPAYGESSFDDARLAQVRQVVGLLLERQEPFPAYAMDGGWNVVAANNAFRNGIGSLERADEAPGGINILRLLCAPDRLRPVLENWSDVTRSVLRRVHRQLDAPAPPRQLLDLIEEIRAYPDVEELFGGSAAPDPNALFVPVSVRSEQGTLRWLTTLVKVGGAIDVALEELVVECFFPADEETDRAARELAEAAAC